MKMMMRMMIGSFIDTFIFIILDVLKSDPNSHFMMLVLIKVMRIEICSMCLSIRLSKSNCYVPIWSGKSKTLSYPSSQASKYSIVNPGHKCYNKKYYRIRKGNLPCLLRRHYCMLIRTNSVISGNMVGILSEYVVLNKVEDSDEKYKCKEVLHRHHYH